MTPIIATVLKSGGDYDSLRVTSLYEQCKRHIRSEFEFYCLTDVPFLYPGVSCLPLIDDLPGWWSKMELFRAFDRAFYLDLDTIVVGDITHMVQPFTGFVALRDLGARPGEQAMGSGVMSWGRGHRHLYDAFMEAPELHMQRYRQTGRWGDQGFIQDMLAPDTPLYVQDIWPGQVASYKFDVRPHGLSPETRIICFHGKPRPWELPAAEINRLKEPTWQPDTP